MPPPFLNRKFNDMKATITNQVHTTKDYFLFKPIDGNRTKNQLHLSRLKKSIETNYLFTVIIVNEKYEIIDGQHRFDVIQELGLPLNYIVCKGYGLNEVHVLNANSKTWNTDDYVDGYSSLGNGYYVIYKAFKETYKFGHNETIALLTGRTNTTGELFLDFKNGKFKIIDLNDAEKKAEMLTLIGQYYKGYNRRSFVYAMLSLFYKPQFKFDEFIHKLELNPSALTNCSDKEQYITLIEEIYNFRRREKVSLKY